MAAFARRTVSLTVRLTSLALIAAVLAVTTASPARAAVAGAIVGHVVDGQTGKPIPAVALIIVPVGPGVESERTLLADRAGFYSVLGLESGWYAVTANVTGRFSTCLVEFAGVQQSRRVDVYVYNLHPNWIDQIRIDPHYRPLLVPSSVGDLNCVISKEGGSTFDPLETQDVYRLH